MKKLTGNQSKLDLNKNGKLDAEDFKMLRSNKMANGGVMNESFPETDAMSYGKGGGVEELSISNPKDLKEFWVNPKNATKKIFFVEEMENEDGSNSYYVVGNQTKRDYDDSQYWDYDGNFENVDDAIKKAKKDAKKNNAIYMDNRRVVSGYAKGGSTKGFEYSIGGL